MNEPIAAQNWLALLYQYGVGGLLFGATMFAIWRGQRTGALAAQMRWMSRLLAGLLLAALLVHAWWIWAAQQGPGSPPAAATAPDGSP